MIEVVASVDEDLGNSAYLVGLGDRRALAIDPPRNLRALRGLARDRGWSLAYGAETHLHADFVSGSRELAASGVDVLAPRAGRYGFPVSGLDHGEEVDLGGPTLRALATPGHTPEHLAYLVLDGARPMALFTGGALLVGAVARTDLIAPDATERLARALYRSLHERILSLPDDLPVYPTHGAGSFCAAPAGGERTTTIGRERAANPLLAAPDEDAFVTRLLAALGSYPPYLLRLREVNRRGPRLLGDRPPVLARLSVAEVRQRVAEGAELVDARPIEAYAGSHIPGALSIALRSGFASWLGWLVRRGRPLVFLLEPDQDRDALVWQCISIGYEDIAGELAGGVASWRDAGLPVEATPLVRSLPNAPGSILDVRQAAEYPEGHVPGALPLELGSVPTGAAGLPDDLTIMCGHGERGASAASLLERVGRCVAGIYLGGPEEWARDTGLALDRER